MSIVWCGAMQILNSPIELGVRSLVILATAFPRALDLNRLVLMDYCLMHSADIGGPSSLLPDLPLRTSELGIRRTSVEHGIQLMIRAGMIEIELAPDGFQYRASENARSFLKLIQSPHLESLKVVAEWVSAEFGQLGDDEVRTRMQEISVSWDVQLERSPPRRWQNMQREEGS